MIIYSRVRRFKQVQPQGIQPLNMKDLKECRRHERGI